MPASELHEVFCANLRAARIQKGLTQLALAELLGMTQAAYSFMEKGRNPPNLVTIEKLAEALDVDPVKLLRRSKVPA